MAVRVRIDHSILIKFSISFKLSVRDKVDIGLMKIHSFDVNLQYTRDFEANVVGTRSPQTHPFVESKLANSGKSAADRIFIQKSNFYTSNTYVRYTRSQADVAE